MANPKEAFPPIAILAILVVALFAIGWSASAAKAQPSAGPGNAQRRTIWDLHLGDHARELSRTDYVDLACGTNGGPPSLPLRAWTDFAKCPAEPDGGLHEVYFRYDDELQYINLAIQPDIVGAPGTAEYQMPIIVSALFDNDGFLAAQRLVTDPRTDPAIRENGASLTDVLKARFGKADWTCTDLPPGDGETPYKGSFVKARCEKADPVRGVRLVLDKHFFRKAGQTAVDPASGRMTTGQFVSETRFEIVLQNRIANPQQRLAALSDAAPSETELLAAKARNCPACDLAGANLKRADLRAANLAGANLTGADLHAANLAGADLTGAKLAGANLNKADLRQTKLPGADLSGAMLYAARLDGADLSQADLSEAMASTAQMIRAKAPGLAASGIDLRAARLSDADFSGADLSMALLNDAQLTRAKLRGADLGGSRLWKTTLTNSDMTGIHAQGTDFTGANLRGANLSAGDFTSADLSSVIFTNVATAGAVFYEAVLPPGFPR